MDLVIAGAVLFAVFPVWVLAALGIKVSSPGPVFFCQRRVGLRGREFTMIKFRSMAVNPDTPSSATSDDPRITWGGKWLRMTSPDEIPNLINVLRGEMSIVGPRPLPPNMIGYCSEKELKRQDAKPGMTGWAQVNGRNALSYQDRLQLDVWYVEHWSIWLDVLILIKTIPIVFSRSGLYQEDS